MAIEPLRREKVLGSSLQAAVTLPSAEADGIDYSELFIVASVKSGAELAVAVTDHHKCGRCWRHLPDVAEDGALCSRCDHVVAGIDASA
jgi:isoleucyl-tRNA synthetase